MQDTGLKINQSAVQVNWKEIKGPEYPRSDLTPIMGDKISQCEDFKSKREEIYKIDHITEIIQCSERKINQSVA